MEKVTAVHFDILDQQAAEPLRLLRACPNVVDLALYCRGESRDVTSYSKDLAELSGVEKLQRLRIAPEGSQVDLLNQLLQPQNMPPELFELHINFDKSVSGARHAIKVFR